MSYEVLEYEPDQAEDLINDLDGDEVDALIKIVANLDRLEMVAGWPRYTEEQIGVIGKFIDFADEHVVTKVASEGDEKLDDPTPSLENPVQSNWGDGSGEDGTEI
jgi:hypothetical protein